MRNSLMFFLSLRSSMEKQATNTPPNPSAEYQFLLIASEDTVLCRMFR